MKFKSIYELQGEWANAESCDELDTRSYCKEKLEQIRLMEGVLELINEIKAKLLYSKTLSEKECKIIEDFEEKLIKEIKGEKDTKCKYCKGKGCNACDARKQKIEGEKE